MSTPAFTGPAATCAEKSDTVSSRATPSPEGSQAQGFRVSATPTSRWTPVARSKIEDSAQRPQQPLKFPPKHDKFDAVELEQFFVWKSDVLSSEG